MFNPLLGTRLLLAATALIAVSVQAHAASITLSIGGPGVSGNFVLTYGAATDSTYPQAFEVTGVTGTFSDSNNGLNIVNAPVVSLVGITHDAPESTNHLAPNDFSRFAVAAGLPMVSNGFITYDNLYYPGGSPQTATDYPAAGGVLDIYGLMFNIGGGQIVNVWSNGNFTGGGLIPDSYGVNVATSAMALDSQDVQLTPEPSSVLLFGGGLLGLLALRQRRMN